MILTSGDGSLTALDASTGTTAWSVTPDAVPVTRTAIGDGLRTSGSAAAPSWRSRPRMARRPGERALDSGTVTAVTAVGDTVYVDGTTTLYALDAATGRGALALHDRVGWVDVPVQRRSRS